MSSQPHDSSQPSGAQRPVGSLAGTSLTFDLRYEISRLKAEETWHRETHNANTLVKQPDVRIVLVAMKSGASLAEHQTAGRISIQVLEGSVAVHLPEGVVDLPAGGLLALDRDVPHGVEAREESAFLLTITWPGE